MNNELIEVVEAKNTLNETVYANVNLAEVRKNKTNLAEYGNVEVKQHKPQPLID